jgi:tetratricopeptide (TPR) repeat protein
MLRNLNSLFAALALTAVTTAALAEEPTKSYPDCGREPTDGEVAAAKGAFQAGNASFNEADYARAIDYWEDAYRRDCTANPLLLNLARAYELAGRKRQAVVSLETFLTREPNSGEKEQIGRRIEVLKKKILEEDAAAASAPAATNGGAVAAPLASSSPLAPAEQPATDKAKRSPGPWIVIGVGGAAMIVGTLGIISNKKKVDDADEECGGNRNVCSVAVADRGNDARSALNASGVITGAGGLLLGGGIVWYILDGRRVENANQALSARPLRARVAPVVGPGVAGLSVSGVF